MAKRRLFHDLADQIIALIDEGVFPPGTRLPGERELAERFDVSRVAIREAEIALEVMGQVHIKSGSGVYVCEQPAAARGELPKVSAFELTEARCLFESEAAALAATNIDDSALAQLDKLVQIMTDEEGGSQAANDADQQFHMTIAEASGNAAIVYTIQSLWRMRMELPQVRDVHSRVCAHDAKARHDEHADILNALKAHEPAAARMAMRAHFNRLISAMLDVTEELALQEVKQKATESRNRFLQLNSSAGLN